MRLASLRASGRTVGVILLGLVMAASLVAASRFVVRVVLEQDALATAQTVLQISSASGVPAAGQFSEVTGFLLLAADGTVLAGGPGEAPARLPEMAMALHKRVLAADEPALVADSPLPESLAMIGRPSFSHAALPAPASHAPVATIYAALDQSGAGGALVRAVDKIALLGAGLVLLATIAASLLLRSGSARRSGGPASVQGGRDVLTGLPDRLQFLTMLEKAIDGARPKDGQLAVLAVNLDRFKMVNDMWGHAAGDAVLRVAAQRLQALSAQGTQLARTSGDAFGMMVEGDANPRSLKHLSQRIIEELSEPFEIGDRSVSLTASVGTAVFPVNAESAHDLFRAADLALYKAKADGGQGARFFDTEMERQLKRRTALESDLRLALKREEFVVFYQPQLDLKSGQVTGYEALVRWERPGEGIVSPGDFIPVAEETGLIRPLGEWILRRACQDAVGWIEKGIIAVNFSAAQFRFAGVDEMVAKVLEETGLDPQRLEIEITEGLFLNHSAEIMSTLRRIKALGVRIAMDDFGTGYSSLSFLSRFPFDKIKIDRSFVRQLSDDPQIAAIISSIVGLGRSLSVDITAEGVETDDQVTLLKAAGCNIVQGFLFGAPQRSIAKPPAQQAGQARA